MTFCVPQERNAQSTKFGLRAGLVGSVLLSFVLASESGAQSTVVIGGSGRPAVEVNLDALDQQDDLFPGSARRLRMPGERSVDVVHLRAPGVARTSQTGTITPRLSLQRPSTPSRLRAPQQATRAMPAAPAPKVIQGTVEKPAAPKAPVRAAARETKPPIPRPSTTAAPRQIATRTVPSRTAPPPPVKAPPPPPVTQTQPPPVAKAPPPPPVAKSAPPPVKTPPPPPPVAKSAPPPVKAPPLPPKTPPVQVTQPRTQPAQTAAARTQPAPSKTPASRERQIASLPRVSLPRDGGQIMRVDFLGATTRLTPDAERSLGSLAATMAESDGRLQLKAYAGGTGETLSSSRRLSLSRALAVRSFLIEQGIRSTRIDVRALGRAEDSGPPERVDIVLLTQ